MMENKMGSIQKMKYLIMDRDGNIERIKRLKEDVGLDGVEHYVYLKKHLRPYFQSIADRSLKNNSNSMKENIELLSKMNSILTSSFTEENDHKADIGVRIFSRIQELLGYISFQETTYHRAKSTGAKEQNIGILFVPRAARVSEAQRPALCTLFGELDKEQYDVILVVNPREIKEGVESTVLKSDTETIPCHAYDAFEKLNKIFFDETRRPLGDMEVMRRHKIQKDANEKELF